MPNKLTRVSLHVENLKFGRAPDLTKPSVADVVADKDVLTAALAAGIERVGLDLTYYENRSLIAVQRMFDETDYKGNAKPVQLPDAAKLNLPVEVPCLDVRISEYLRAFAVRYERSPRAKMEYNLAGRRAARRALDSLASKQFLIVYERKYERQGKGKKKNSIIELVAPLVAVTRSGGRLVITPNPVLIDQIDSHFLWLPTELFSKLVPTQNKSALLFVEYILFKYEMERRKGAKAVYQVRLQQETMGQLVRMTSQLKSRQVSGLRKSLIELYDLGVKIGYLEKYELDVPSAKVEKVDVLYLNEANLEAMRKV